MDPSVWMRGCRCVFGCVYVGACVVQVCVYVRVLPRVCFCGCVYGCVCMGACVFVLPRACGCVCGFACEFVCGWVCEGAWV